MSPIDMRATRALLIAASHDDVERVRASLIDYYHADATDLAATDGAASFDFRHAATLSKGMERLTEEHFDLVIADLMLPDAHGLQVFASLYAQAPDLPIVVLVGSEDELLALKAVQHGAQDYILKDKVHGGLVARAAQHAVQYRATEEALARERERLAVTLRSIGEGVITTDTTGKVSLINRMAEELTGWSQEEGRGRHLDEVFTTRDEETRQPRANPLAHLLAGATATEFGTAILTDRAGRERLVESTGAPLRDREGTIIGAVLVFRDITTQRQLQEERLRADKLESIGKLAGGIAHDFNNLLVGILGNLSMAREEGTTDAERRDLLEAAEAATLKARDLASQLLTFASGGAPIKTTTTIDTLLADTARLALSGSNVRADLSLGHDLWTVEVDEAQITQAVAHLIDNARHAMPGGGTIRIRAMNVDTRAGSEAGVGAETGSGAEAATGDLSGGSWGDARTVGGGIDGRGELRPGRYLRVTIEDDGGGIPPDVLPRIFDPYFTTRVGASGLGLAIAYSIITRHDGRIVAQSTPGRGSSFQLYIPAAEPEAPVDVATGQVTAPDPGDPSFSLRVLLMDDDDTVRQVAARMLEWLGCEVATAEDGAKAIELYDQARAVGAPFQLVIMDLTVPGGMGGREAIRLLRDLDPDIRAIVSSGYFNDPIMANYREHGFAGVIAKPYQLDNLRDAIEQVLGWTL